MTMIIDPREPPYNAAANGSTDDAAALQSALNSGNLVWLAPNATFAFGTQLTIPANGGFVGGGTLRMLTGTGKFDVSTYAGGFSKAGVYAYGVSNIIVEAKIEMEASTSIRTCSGIAVRNCIRPTLDIEASNFKEAEFPIVTLDSVTGGVVRAYVHDCGTNSTTLPTMQITGVGVDANRVGGLNSTGIDFDVDCRRIRLGAAARAHYGEQTDGFNGQAIGYAGLRGTIYAEDVGEGCDLFSDHCNLTVVARNCYNNGVKLIHGASYNIIKATVDGTAKSALVLGGASDSTSPKVVQRNRIELTASRVGELDPGAYPNSAAVATDSTSATYRPMYNHIAVTAYGNGSAMKYVVFEESGSNNFFDADGDGWATQFAYIASTAGAGKDVSTIRRARKSIVQAYIGTATTITNGAGIPYDTVITDTNGEFAAGIFTSHCAGWFNVKAQVRLPAIASNADVALAVFKNGGTIIHRCAAQNYAATVQPVWVTVSAAVWLNGGETLQIKALTAIMGPVNVTNIADYSFIEIEQV
ncbi:hypothetical protein [Sphingomonas sp.]|uniref:hypothetical protein n=1 Tax=Sphingomonas sp. TaxID=28214 RepID=UPI003D6C9C1C